MYGVSVWCVCACVCVYTVHLSSQSLHVLYISLKYVVELRKFQGGIFCKPKAEVAIYIIMS